MKTILKIAHTFSLYTLHKKYSKEDQFEFDEVDEITSYFKKK